MRHAAGLVLGMALIALTSTAQAMVGSPGTVGDVKASAPAVTNVEYFCSPGFEPSYGGTCVAVAPRAEIELFVDQPIYSTPITPSYRPYVRHRRRHGIRERY